MPLFNMYIHMIQFYIMCAVIVVLLLCSQMVSPLRVTTNGLGNVYTLLVYRQSVSSKSRVIV